MRRVLVALLSLALVATACGGGEPEQPEPEPEPTTTSPSPEPEPVLAPLTGEEVDEESVVERPVVAVKIDNARPARPQKGLNEADVVFEELVEGGSTRFLALFHSRLPIDAGPVRSGRDVDADIVKPWEPLLAISGAAPPTYAVLRGAGLEIREEEQPADAWYRDSGRNRPYNLFTDVAALAEVAADVDLPAPQATWTFDEAVPSGEEATGVSMAFSPSVPVSWTWESGAWQRTQSGAAHETDDGTRVSAANVVVLRVPVQAGGGVDVAGSATQHINVIGEGDAMVLRDGRAVSARWRKASREGHLMIETAGGTPVALAPGRTWIELLPSGAALEVQRPAATETAETATESSR